MPIKIIDEHYPANNLDEQLSAPRNYPYTKNYDYTAKHIILGNKGVGKTSLLLKYIKNSFAETPSPFETGYIEKLISLNDRILKNQFWELDNLDIKLPPEHKRPLIFTITLVFDLTDEASFNDLTKYLTKIDQWWFLRPRIILVGTKADKVFERKIEQESIDNFIEQNEISAYIQTSAKTGNNIQAFFKTLSSFVYNIYNAEDLSHEQKELHYDVANDRYYFHNIIDNQENKPDERYSCTLL